MTFALVILVAIALAGLTYLWLERVGTKAWPAIACRAVAWAALGVLLVNLTCALPASSLKPMVLFDGSLSLTPRPSLLLHNLNLSLSRNHFLLRSRFRTLQGLLQFGRQSLVLIAKPHHFHGRLLQQHNRGNPIQIGPDLLLPSAQIQLPPREGSHQKLV